MTLGSTWQDIDRGYAKIVRGLVQANGIQVTVGIHGDEAAYSRGSGEPATVPQIASFQEFGTTRIPERSFLRSTVDEKTDDWVRFTNRLLKRLTALVMDVPQVLNLLGVRMQSDVQKKIRALRTPPNAPSTIARKKSSNPLIDTGRLIQSVTYQVSGGGGLQAGALGRWQYRGMGRPISIGGRP
jgi:hypothetical protein